jgi:hypothetical protein
VGGAQLGNRKSEGRKGLRFLFAHFHFGVRAPTPDPSPPLTRGEGNGETEFALRQSNAKQSSAKQNNVPFFVGLLRNRVGTAAMRP